MPWLLPALAAFSGGVLVSFINSRITRSALKKGRNPVLILPLRTLITAAYLTGVYLISVKLGADPAYTLIAAALGATLGLVIFTARLMPQLQQAQDPSQGEGEQNG